MSSASLTPAAQAEALLQEWEQRPGQPHPPADAPTRPARLARLAALCAALRPEADVNIDHEDIRTALRWATDFRIGTAAATGPYRAAHVAGAVLAALQPLLTDVPAGPAQSALLGVVSPVAEPLAMDELTTIVETIQRQLGHELEMIFGHGETADAADAELRVWLLVGYAATGPTPVAMPAVVPPPPPDAGGRDAAFVAAAYLLVRHQKASTSLLQRELKLGYNRTSRLLDQLAQAGIVGFKKPGESAYLPVLVADEGQLAQLLTHLPPFSPPTPVG